MILRVRELALYCAALSISFGGLIARGGMIERGTEQAHLDFANDPIFQSVGWMKGDKGGVSYLAGSAVLVAPNWLLTAGHAVDDAWESVSFSLDLHAQVDANFYAADAWYVYPGYVEGAIGAGNDLALVHLVDPVTNIVPAKIYAGTVMVGTHAYYSGYGSIGYYFPEGEFLPAGTKAGGENIIDALGDQLTENQYMLADFGPAWHTITLPLEMTGTNGDSGGGWFADLDGSFQLIGISSFQRGGSVTTGAIRPAVYLDWINETTGVPEPSAVVLLAGGVPFLRVRRRVAVS